MKRSILFTVLCLFSFTVLQAQNKIFFSEVADPGDVSNAKFVELFNAGATDVDLASEAYYIVRQANGGSYASVKLTGTIAPGGVFVVGYNATEFKNAYGFDADMISGVISGNGDDGYFLYVGGDQNSGTLVDAYGVPDEDGTGKAWEYKDAHAVRNSNIGAPNPVWTASEWTITSADVADMTPGKHTFITPGPPNWSNGYPHVINVRDNKGTVVVNMDRPGKAYAIVLFNDATAPTSDQVKAGQDYDTVHVLVYDSVEVLEAGKDYYMILSSPDAQPNTPYDVYVVAQDDQTPPNLQGSPVKLDITTTGPRSLNMTQPKDKDTIYVGGSLHFEWTSQNIDSLYMAGQIKDEIFIITDDDDQPIAIDASLGSYNLDIPEDAEGDTLSLFLTDAADTSFRSNMADSIRLIDAREITMTQPVDKDTIYVGGVLHFEWTSQYIDSIYMGVIKDGHVGIIPGDNDQPLAVDASLGSYDIQIPGDAEEGIYDLLLMDAADTSIQSNVADSVLLIDARELTMTQPKEKDTIYAGDTLHFKWTSKYIDSIYIALWEGDHWNIYEEEDGPVAIDASLGSYNIKIPGRADEGTYSFVLMDATDTTFKSNIADSVALIDARVLEWVSPEDKDSVYVGDTVKLVWNSEYIDSVYFAGYDYTSDDDFILEDENGNPLVYPASLGSIDLPVPLDAETDSISLYIVDASDPDMRDTIDPLYILDTIAPRIEELTPANGAVDMPFIFTAVLKFNETVNILTGNITLHNEDGSVVKTYDLNGSSVDHDESTIMISLDTVLEKGSTYYFTMDAGAVEDLKHNAFGGISDANTWKFTTATKQLYFSEYVEGGYSNKALEIYNPTDHTIDLSKYAIINTSSGSNWYPPAPMTGMLAPGEVYTIINPAFDFSLLADSAAVVDTLWGAYATYFNGDDARGLVQLLGGSWDDNPNYTIIDQIGVEGVDPGSGWDVAGVSTATKDHTLIRKITVETGNATTGWAASAGTDEQNSEWIVMPKDFMDNLGYPTPNASDNTTIIAFELRDTMKRLVSSKVTIDSATATITAEVIYTANSMVSMLIPVITVADDGTTLPASGDTLDFTSPVTFTVTAADGLTTREWTVTVTVATSPSTAADILSFSIEGETEEAVIDTVNNTVTVEMPYGTDVSALTPVFEVSAGAQADPVSGTPLDFTGPVTIKVTAEDGSTVADWTVTVNVFTPPTVAIRDIQYTTDSSGDSPYLGQIVKTSGIVTALNIYQDNFKGYFLQDSAKAWNGIYVYDPAHDTIAVGDSVTIVGEVTEYYNLTEIKNVMDLTLHSRGNALPGPVELTTGEANNEMWEGVFVTFHNATCLDNNLGHGEVSVDDGSGALIVDDFLYYYDPATDFVIDNVYNLTGVMNFSYGNFKLNPRSADDISDVTGIRNAFSGDNVRVWPNPTDGNFTVAVEGMNGDVRITLMDAAGRVLLTRNPGRNNFIQENFNLSNTSRGLYFIRIDNGKEVSVKRIVIR